VIVGLIGGLGNALGSPAVTRAIKSLVGRLLSALRPKLARLGWAAAAGLFVFMEAAINNKAKPASHPPPVVFYHGL
jgi:hypothetical protein